MDVLGGGPAAEDRRVVKDDGYGSDNEVDSRGDVAWKPKGAPLSGQKGSINRSISAAVAPPEDDVDSSGVPAPSGSYFPSGTTRDLSAEPKGGNLGGMIAPPGGIAGLRPRSAVPLVNGTAQGDATLKQACDRTLFAALEMRTPDTRLMDADASLHPVKTCQSLLALLGAATLPGPTGWGMVATIRGGQNCWWVQASRLRSTSSAGAGDARPAGEYRQKSPESAAQPMLVDGTVIQEGQGVSPTAVARASDVAAAEQGLPGDEPMPEEPARY